MGLVYIVVVRFACAVVVVVVIELVVVVHVVGLVWVAVKSSAGTCNVGWGWSNSRG